jgi:MOSC domain-containing protein YiiM
MSGVLVSIHIAREAAGPMELLSSVRAVPGRGLDGDRYAAGEGSFSKMGGTGREVTLIASEMIELLERESGIRLKPGDARRNLVTRNVALNDLVGKTFKVGAVRMKGIRLAEPCEHLQRLTQPGVTRGLAHRAGLRAILLDEGVLSVGDEIREILEQQ